MRRSSFADDPALPLRDSYLSAARDPYGYPTTSARDSRWDVSEYSLRPTARGQESSSSSSSRPRSRSRSARPPTSTREMHRKRKSSGSSKDKDKDKDKDASTAVASPAGNVFSVSPAAIFNNLQSAFNAFQSLPGLSPAAPSPGAVPGAAGLSSTSFELSLPDAPVTNLLNPQNLHVPPSQAVLHARLAANLPRHGNAYLILLVGTLLTSHWLVLAALFGVVKFGLFVQSYNGRDIARDLGVRKYASSQAVMSGFAAATVFVGLWAFSSVFSVVFTLVKVACLVLLHAAFFEVDEQQQQQRRRVISGSSVSASASASTTSLAVPPQGVLRPAGSSLSPRDAAAFAGQQLRSASEGHLSTAHSNGWYAGEGYVGAQEDEYAAMPRTPRSFDQYPPSPRRDEYGVADANGHWGYYETGRPQSYASGRSY